MRLITLMLAALLAACSGGDSMSQPAVIITDPSISPTVTASSTASGYAAADVLVGNELKGWKPTIATPAWSDAAITELPYNYGIATSNIVSYGGYIYANLAGPKTVRLALSNLAGSWDDAGVTDIAVNGGTHGYTGGMYGSKWISGAFAFGAFYVLDLATPTGSWALYNSAACGIPSDGSYKCGVVVGSKIYVAGPSAIGIVDLDNIGTFNTTTINSSPGNVTALTAVGNVLYAFTTTNSKIWKIDLDNIAGGWVDCGTPPFAPTSPPFDYYCRLFPFNGALHIGCSNTNYSGVIWRMNDTSSVVTYSVVPTTGSVNSTSAIFPIDSSRLIAFGHRTTPDKTTSVIDLSQGSLTFDMATPQTPMSVALLADNATEVVCTITASDDSGFATEMVMGAVILSGPAGWLDLRSNTTAYRYWKVKFGNIGSTFIVRHVRFGGLNLLPFMDDGFDKDRYQVKGSQLISSSGYYIGSVRQATMRTIPLNFGQVTETELGVIRTFAEQAIAQLQPFFFVPYVDSTDCYWAWCDDKQDFSAPQRLGLFDVATIDITARRV
jgi:hypothetical protein